MRKIERQMNSAIRSGKNFSSANTTVRHGFEGEADVYLHGNHIATVKSNSIIIKDGGWQSNTTKSRLNAILSEHGDIGDRVFQKAFDWFVSMNTAQGITTVPFFSSMKLANF